MVNKKKYTKKSLLAILVALMLLVSLVATPFAMAEGNDTEDPEDVTEEVDDGEEADDEDDEDDADDEEDEEDEEDEDAEPAITDEEAAELLKKLGLFQGTGDDEDGNPMFELDREPTRAEGLVMLIRLLGEEEAALACEEECPFEDVPEWFEKYAAYGYAMGYTNGISETEFDPDTDMTATQYLTFILRSLGYISGEDFEWDSAWTLTDKLGITDGEFDEDNNDLLRGDVALVSLATLFVEVKEGNKLITVLIEAKAVEAEAAMAVVEELAEAGAIAPETALSTIENFVETGIIDEKEADAFVDKLAEAGVLDEEAVAAAKEAIAEAAEKAPVEEPAAPETSSPPPYVPPGTTTPSKSAGAAIVATPSSIAIARTATAATTTSLSFTTGQLPTLSMNPTGTGQTYEYLISDSNTTATAVTGAVWQTSLDFTGISVTAGPGTVTYYIWVRAQESTTHSVGTAKMIQPVTITTIA